MLVVRIGAMGDVLHAMPAVAAMCRRHPDWTIGWAIEPRWSELLQTASEFERSRYGAGRSAQMPLVDRWHPVPTKAWGSSPLAWETMTGVGALRRELKDAAYDVCVDMQGSIKSAVIGRMAGAKTFVGPAAPREREARWLYGQRVAMHSAHVVEQGCELLGAAIGEELQPSRVPLPQDEEAEVWRDALLTPIVRPDERFALMAPTAGWGAKQWPAERYGALAALLAKTGVRTLVNESSASDEVAARVVETSGGAAVAIPCSIGDLIALIRRASVVIAGDTGPLHLAAALERPVVGLFGPTDPERNGPYGRRSRTLRHASSRRDHTRRTETEEGLMQIKVSEVEEATMAMLRAGQDRVTA